jgi:hypothetical protein
VTSSSVCMLNPAVTCLIMFYMTICYLHLLHYDLRGLVITNKPKARSELQCSDVLEVIISCCKAIPVTGLGGL